MTRYEKAKTHLNRVGCKAMQTSNGVSVLLSHSNEFHWVGIRESEVDLWAMRYDETIVEDLRETDPREVLEEVARIFHNLGWNLGNNGAHDTSYIESSEKYLETVYKAFNPYNKK